METDPETAPVVQTAFRTFLKERSLTATAKWLNANHYRVRRTTQGGGDKPRLGHFTFANLHCILRNPAYVGIKRYETKDGWQESKAVWEPIVSEALFEQVQELLSKNYCRYKPDSPERYPFQLSGIVHCGKCNERLSGKTATGKKGRYPYYEHAWLTKRQSCLASKILSCDPRRVLANRLEPAVWEAVLALLKDSRLAQGIIAEAKQTHDRMSQSTEAKRIRDKISSIAGQLDALSERLAQLPKGVPAGPIYKQMEKIEAARQEEQTRLEALEQNAQNDGAGRGLPSTQELYEEFLTSVRQIAQGPMGPELKSKIIALLVAKIEVLPDSFRLHFRVGENQISRELAQNAGSRLFLCPELNKTHRVNHKTHEGPGSFSSPKPSLNFSGNRCSHSLTNGVPTGIRTPVCAVRGRAGQFWGESQLREKHEVVL